MYDSLHDWRLMMVGGACNFISECVHFYAVSHNCHKGSWMGHSLRRSLQLIENWVSPFINIFWGGGGVRIYFIY